MIYVGLILLLHLPFVQKQMGSWVANALSEKLGTEVKVGNVNLGFLNRLIIDDIYAEDLEGRPMLKVARTSASFNIISLLKESLILTTFH